MEPMNWKGRMGKLKSSGMEAHTCFFMEKRVEDEEDKKLVHLTQSCFPMCLKTLKKQAIKQKKKKGAQEARHKEDLIPKAFPSATCVKYGKFYLYGQAIINLHKVGHMNQANKTKINELMSKWVNYGLIILTPPLKLDFMSNK